MELAKDFIQPHAIGISYKNQKNSSYIDENENSYENEVPGRLTLMVDVVDC